MVFDMDGVPYVAHLSEWLVLGPGTYVGRRPTTGGDAVVSRRLDRSAWVLRLGRANALSNVGGALTFEVSSWRSLLTRQHGFAFQIRVQRPT